MIRQQSKGFTLVELMICIVLALFIVGGLYTMLGSSQLSYALTRANNALNGSGQRVTQLIWNHLHQAGYVNYQRQIMQWTLPAGGTSLGANNWTKGQSLFAENNITGVTGLLDNSDRLTLRFWGSSISDNDPAQLANQATDSRMFDCNGEAVSNQNLVQITLYVNSSGDLICQDNRNHTVVMERNIASLQFRFRRAGTNQQFVTANVLTAATWPTVAAIEFGVLTTQASGQGVKATARSYQILEQNVNAAADNLIRQSLTGSITLKN
jgi:prepilin-type N-terminal cleavage/methylation domain-containing protein